VNAAIQITQPNKLFNLYCGHLIVLAMGLPARLKSYRIRVSGMQVHTMYGQLDGVQALMQG
jgi:hypothetical protein